MINVLFFWPYNNLRECTNEIFVFFVMCMCSFPSFAHTDLIIVRLAIEYESK
jgi:hypothetical protein